MTTSTATGCDTGTSQEDKNADLSLTAGHPGGSEKQEALADLGVVVGTNTRKAA
jgi:hypothetical protein